MAEKLLDRPEVFGLARAGPCAKSGYRAASAALTPSTQTISSAVTGPILANGGSILVTGGGSIAGGAEGVFAENCSITTLSNMGSIGAAIGAPAGAGGAGVLTNSGPDHHLLSNATGGKISGGNGAGGSFGDRRRASREFRPR
jgi:hypothetical protein